MVKTPGFYLYLTLASNPGVTHIRFERKQKDIEDLWRITFGEHGREASIRDTEGHVLHDGPAHERKSAAEAQA